MAIRVFLVNYPVGDIQSDFNVGEKRYARPWTRVDGVCFAVFFFLSVFRFL